MWAVSTMPNGDIVSGCSDDVVRVFSESEDRWVSAEDMKVFEDQVASQALPSQQVGDVKKTDLPGPEALNNPGKKSGDVKMIKNGDIVEAHQVRKYISMTLKHVVTLYSGTAPLVPGRRSATSLTLLGQGASSYMKAKNTTTFLMLTSRMVFPL